MNAMSCDVACRLMDDYLEQRLSQRDRQRLGAHFARCGRCADELRNRSAFEQHLRRELSRSVQPLCLSPQTSARVIRAAHGSARRGIWSGRLLVAAQIAGSLAGLAILMAGLLYALGHISPSSVPTPVVLPALNPAAAANNLIVEPARLHPGELFTTTLLFRNERPEPLEIRQIHLDIEGPRRGYHFVLAAQSALPGESVSVLRVTHASLVEASRRQYRITPEQIFDTPGVYTIRMTLVSPIAAPER